LEILRWKSAEEVRRARDMSWQAITLVRAIAPRWIRTPDGDSIEWLTARLEALFRLIELRHLLNRLSRGDAA
jgi:hypothetical protein